MARTVFTPKESCRDIVNWVRECGGSANRVHPIRAVSGIYVETTNGTVLLRDKAWLIKEVDGRFTTCRPAMFKIMYDPA